jgi:hypothetical protein
MRRKLMAIVLVVCMLSLAACNPKAPEPPTRVESSAEATPLEDFYIMGIFPQAEQIQPLERVTKFWFDETTSLPGESAVVIDIGNRTMYSNAAEVAVGITEPDIALTDADITQLLDILVKYDVQSWDEHYSTAETNYADGFGWTLMLEYDDQTVEMHYGSAPHKEDCIPDNYDAFLEELLAFRDARIG